MLVDLEVIPVGGNAHIGDAISNVVQIIDAADIPYVLTPSGTCIEGTWDQVMPVIRQCHERLRKDSPHVFTSIRIEDEEGVTNKLRHNLTSVTEKAEQSGRSLNPSLRVS